MTKNTQNVVIVGATSGIGLELLKLYAGETDQLVGAGTREIGKLPADWPARADYFRGDQSSDGFAGALHNHIASKGWGHIDVLVLNAGIGWVSGDGQQPERQIRETIDTNLTGTIAIAHELHGKLSAADNRSRLTLIGSVANKGASGFPAYAASKAGMVGLARALRQEWRDAINVQIIHPGPTATQMHAKAGLEPGFAQRFFLHPKLCAVKIKRLIEKGKPVATVSFGDGAINWVQNRLGGGVRI